MAATINAPARLGAMQLSKWRDFAARFIRKSFVTGTLGA
jgi:hypothetical protein